MKRYEIVNGLVEVDSVADEPAEDNDTVDEAKEGKGVPDFWLTVMKTNEVLSEEIHERDEDDLKHLKDIKCSKLDDLKEFKLEFFFNPNPHFKNYVLSKTYHMIDDYDLILRKKARLVAKGYIQHEGVDFEEVFAPVARLKSARHHIAFAAHEEWAIHHMDVKTAFLDGDLKQKVYIDDLMIIITGSDAQEISKSSTAPATDLMTYQSIVGSLRYLVHTQPDILIKPLGRVKLQKLCTKIGLIEIPEKEKG